MTSKLFKGITLRYGAVGKYGSIAIIERFFRTLKKEWLRKILIPLDINGILRKLTMYIRWYNFHRPHQGLDGVTPAEIYSTEPQKGDTLKFDYKEKLQLLVTFYEGDRQLPIIRLKRAA